MKYKIVSDSSANVLDMDVVNYTSVPLKIVTAEKEYIDDEKLDVNEMARDLKEYKGKSGTSCPNSQEWIEAFEDADVVVGTAITSGLSGSYAASMVAKQEYEENNPDKKVFIFDTLSAGPEMELILEYMKKLVAEEKSCEEIEAAVKEYAKQTHLLFALESLTNLARNGRVSPLVAMAAGALGIRVVGKASAAGQLEQLHKCRGEKKTLAMIYTEMKAHGFKGGKVRISHTDNENAARSMENMIRKDYSDCDIEIRANTALCAFYSELGGILVGYEG